MCRKAIGEKKLSNAEKKKRYRERKNSAEKKLKDKLWKQKEHGNLYKNPEKHKKYSKKKNIAQKKQRNALKSDQHH